MKPQLEIQDIVNKIFEHNSNAEAIINTNKEKLLLLEQETDSTKKLAQLYRGKLTSSEVEVLKQKFEFLHKQVNDVLTNIGLFKNELMLREKMDATEVEPEPPATKKEQFNKDFDSAFDFSKNKDVTVDNARVEKLEPISKPEDEGK